jgi:hypothetical protein
MRVGIGGIGHHKKGPDSVYSRIPVLFNTLAFSALSDFLKVK